MSNLTRLFPALVHKNARSIGSSQCAWAYTLVRKVDNLRNIQASPATTFFAPTNAPQPLVSKCRFGCPIDANNKNNITS